MNKAVKLLPCPFSGKKAKLCKTRNEAGKIKYYVSCGDINTKSFTQAKSAINIWNTRANPSLEAIIEKIEGEKKETTDFFGFGIGMEEEDERENLRIEGANSMADRIISIIREFQTNQTKGN